MYYITKPFVIIIYNVFVLLGLRIYYYLKYVTMKMYKIRIEEMEKRRIDSIGNWFVKSNDEIVFKIWLEILWCKYAIYKYTNSKSLLLLLAKRIANEERIFDPYFRHFVNR